MSEEFSRAVEQLTMLDKDRRNRGNYRNRRKRRKLGQDGTSHGCYDSNFMSEQAYLGEITPLMLSKPKPELDVELTLEEKALLMEEITPLMLSEPKPELDVELTLEEKALFMEENTLLMQSELESESEEDYSRAVEHLTMLHIECRDRRNRRKEIFCQDVTSHGCFESTFMSKPEEDVVFTWAEQALLREITPLMLSEPEPELDVELTFEEKALFMEDNTPLMQSEPELESESVEELERECKAYIRDFYCQRGAGYSSQHSTGDSLDEFDSTLEEKALLMERRALEKKPLEQIAPPLDFKKMCQGLYIVSCKQFAELDPKQNALVPTRFYTFNTAYFDLDEESEATHGLPIRGLPFSQFRTNAGLSNNVVSLKITESDVGYPIRVFGTVIARDVVDYKCLYLFRRERDDPQLINSPKDELILTGPRRAFVTPDMMFFEINLKIKGAPGIAEGDFSKGVMEHNTIRYDDRAIARYLTSWRSTVEIVCTPVPYPVEATLEVKVLKGPRDVPFSSHVITWTDGYEDNPITLYEYDDSREAGTRGSIGNDGSVALDRNLVAVPVILPSTVGEDIKLVLDIGLIDSHDTEEFTHFALQFPYEEVVCRNGPYELQLKVTWRAVRYSPNHDRCLFMPLPRRTAHSWIWELIFHGCCGWS